MDWKKLGYSTSLTPDLSFGYEALLQNEFKTGDSLVFNWLNTWNLTRHPGNFVSTNMMPSCRPIQAPTGPTNWLRHGYDADWLTADVVPSGYLPATAGLVLPVNTRNWRWNHPQGRWVLHLTLGDYQIDTSYAPVCVPANFYSSSVAAATVATAPSVRKIVLTAALVTYPNPMLGPGAMAWGYDKEWPDALASMPVWAELVATSGVNAKIEIGDIYWDLGFMAWIQARSSVFGMSIQGHDLPVARGVKSLDETVTPSAPAVWYCNAGSCRDRENDVGHVCYWCGSAGPKRVTT